MKISLILKLTLITFFIALFGVVLAFQNISTNIFLWEFQFSWKIILFIIFILLLYNSRLSSLKEFVVSNLKNFNLKNVIIYLFVPLIASFLLLIIGITFGEIQTGEIKDFTLFVFGIIFDFPAIWLFSITIILIEEIIFRGILLSEFTKSGKIAAFIIPNLLFTLYYSDEFILQILKETNIVWSNISLLASYYFFSGIIATLIVSKFATIWEAYSLRVGIVSFSQIISTSIIYDGNSYFITKNSYFMVEGIIFLFLLLVLIFFYNWIQLFTINKRS